MANPPSINGSNGRNARGQLAAGNPGGPGNPHIKKVAALRTTLLKTVTHRDLQAIVKSLIERAKAGDVFAAREVFDRCFGKPRQGVDMDLGMEVATLPGAPDLTRMTDMEIAEVIEAAEIPLPPILKAKADLIRAQAAEPPRNRASRSLRPRQSRPYVRPSTKKPRRNERTNEFSRSVAIRSSQILGVSGSGWVRST